MSATTDSQLLITRIKTLPPLPEGSVRIVNAVNNPDISIDELVAVISLSPALVARLLGLANSSYFGRTTPVTDLKSAIIQVLGFNLVKSLALGIALNVEFDVSRCPQFDSLLFWRFVLTRALIAQKLAAKSRDESLTATTVYTGALLMDIGIQAAVYVFPEKMNALFGDCQRERQCVDRKIQAEFGISHYELGSQLLYRWQLPEIYAHSLQSIAQKNDREEKILLVALLRLSQQITQDIFDDKLENLSHYQKELDWLGWTETSFQAIFLEMEKRKSEIQELAEIIHG